MAKNGKKATDILLTPANLTSKKTVEKLEIPGFEKVIDHLRGLKKQMDDLDTDFQQKRAPLVALAADEKRKAEDDGKLYKTIQFPSSCDVPAEVVFKNTFKALDVSNEKPMREALGTTFDELYKLSKVTSVKKDADLGVLKALLGDENFNKFFVTNEFIEHQDGFQERRAAMRPKISQKLNDIIDSFTRQCQAAPDLKLGKIPDQK